MNACGIKIKKNITLCLVTEDNLHFLDNENL